jgi:hypothetical protein
MVGRGEARRGKKQRKENKQMKLKTKLIELVEDFELYPRNDVSSSHIGSLADAIVRGDPLPPIVIERKSKRIVDGIHRSRAYRKAGIAEIEVEARSYHNDAEMFADAVRLNSQHGRSLDPYDRRRAVAKLTTLGLKKVEIAEIVRIPVERIDEWTGELVRKRTGEHIVIKRGLAPYIEPQTKLNEAQVKLNERWSGQQPTFHVNQLIALLEADIVPEFDSFHTAMDRLVDLWKEKRRRRAA